MGRNTGPSCKQCRRSRAKLYLKGERCLTAKCEIEKRNFPPGIRSTMQRRPSEFGRRLREKQKLRFMYGVTESQMRNNFKKASKQKGLTGENLLSLFERRLDNVVYRAHLARSRSEARQMIRHGFFKVNGKKMDIPSYISRIDDVVEMKDFNKEKLEDYLKRLKERSLPTWLEFETTNKTIKLLHVPKREEMDVPVEEQLIVEFYSR